MFELRKAEGGLGEEKESVALIIPESSIRNPVQIDGSVGKDYNPGFGR
jgi:hypothetical protein